MKGTRHASRPRGETEGAGGVRRWNHRTVVAVLLAALLLVLTTAVALAVTGDLTQPAGTAGCISDDGSGPCTDGRALNGAASVAVSPDGKSVYAASVNNDSVVRFNRNTTTGAITQPAGTAGCISEGGSGPCADGHGLDAAASVAVSPDGKSVYVASFLSNAVVRLTRNTTTGAITQPAGTAGCISEDGSGPCADGHGLDSANGVAVSPDNKSVYVASQNSNAVVRLTRNTTTGAITEPAGTAGCVSDDGTGPCANGHALIGASSVAVSANGKSIYVASFFSNAVVRLNRNTTTGAITEPAGTAGCVSDDGTGPCLDGHALADPQGVAVSPDGKSVYAATQSNAVVRLTRNTTTGAITQPAGTAGCVSDDGTGPCANGHALIDARAVTVSSDNESVYATADESDAVVRLTRNATNGAITQPAGTTGCISETGSGGCVNGRGLDFATSVAVSPNARSVYVASEGSSAVARFNRAP